MKLNEKQLAAVHSLSENIFCIAGAGSGKTSTLVARIERLVRDGADPKEMTAITYTVAAAAELQSRLKFRLGFVGTLHSFCLRLLKVHHQIANLPEVVSIMDDEQREAIARRLAEELGSKASWKSIKAILADDRFIEPAAGGRYQRDELVAVEYHRQMRMNGVLDFDAVLRFGLKVARAMAVSPPITDWFWRHLFVDEYQDAADVDAAIYEELPSVSKFFVGDTDQAIFAFRGGNIANALRLATDGRFEVHTLEKNYRCAGSICEAAQRLVERNRARYPKQTVAALEGGHITVTPFPSPAGEQAFVCDQLFYLDYKTSAAVLCRTNRVADGIREFLQARGIKVAEREREEFPTDWRLCKLFISLCSNPWNDFVAYQYLVERHGKEFADVVKHRCSKAMISINEGHLHFENIDTFSHLQIMVEQGFTQESVDRVSAAGVRLTETGYLWTMSDLVSLLNSSERRTEFGSGVVVTTMNASKGREFDVVFICGAEQAQTPGTRADTNVEEERRLFYVAMTRARSVLSITWCRERPKPFGSGFDACAPTQFIAEAGL